MHALVRTDGLRRRGCALCRRVGVRVDGGSDGTMAAAPVTKRNAAASALEEYLLHTHTEPYKNLYTHMLSAFGFPPSLVSLPTPLPLPPPPKTLPKSIAAKQKKKYNGRLVPLRPALHSWVQGPYPARAPHECSHEARARLAGRARLWPAGWPVPMQITAVHWVCSLLFNKTLTIWYLLYKHCLHMQQNLDK